MYFKSLFSGLSLNSNQKFTQDFFGVETDFLFIKTTSKQILILSSLGDTYGCLEKQLDSGLKNLSYVFHFYSTYFYLPHLDQILLNMLSRYKEATISRIDLCLDTSVPVDQIWKEHKTRFQKHMIL